MAIDKFQVSIPNDFLPVLQHLSEGKSVDETIRVSLAISLFVERAVTLERAAELSGLSLMDFMSVLRKKGIPWGEYTEEHFLQDQAFIQKRFAEKQEAKDE
ncbi:UPF0175 family protein [Effusibacillus consociatus]|uniref:UPF0175 family protein n=1 Tax=Effusibacillus consociatus TaxID=1117041 RepID=A0ABV9PYT2_9BACL